MTAGAPLLPQVKAAGTSEASDNEDYVERDDEMDELFLLLLAAMKKGKEEWKALKWLMHKRAEVLILNALKGLKLTGKDTRKILDGPDTEQKKILLAAIDNLVDFGVVEEYQMASELQGYGSLKDIEGEEQREQHEEMIDSYNAAINSKYNKTWAVTEDRDVIWAAVIARQFMGYREDTILVYTTQGDERVRPWHRALEGLAYPKESFPHWLIPPIEWRCRCYLVDEDVVRYGAVEVEDAMIRYNADPAMPEWIDPVFKESLAKGGRIFSDAHRYFQVDKRHKAKLTRAANEIKKSILEDGWKNENNA